MLEHCDSGTSLAVRRRIPRFERIRNSRKQLAVGSYSRSGLFSGAIVALLASILAAAKTGYFCGRIGLDRRA
jgi:hypothetical protein